MSLRHRLLVLNVLLGASACVVADERGCVHQPVEGCQARYLCVRLDGGASDVGYEVGPDRVFVSCEVPARCEEQALQRCQP